MAVPYTFGSATSAIPLSQLDSNFATTITLGNTAIQLGNTVTTLNNMTMANVTVSSAATPVPEAAGGTGTTTGYYGFKNRIINGAMVISQRNGTSATSVSGNDVYTLDRYKGWANGGGVFSVTQSTTAPSGFSNSSLITVTTADSSIAASDNYRFAQVIEGYNIADLGFGASGASTVTISFWVRSSITGTFGGSLYSSPATRSYVFNYTISSANTWEQKTVTIAGDTSGSWNNTNGQGVTVYFDLGSGSNYENATGSWVSSEKFRTSGNATLISTLNNTWYITGVQLEKGSTATSFDYRPYGTELALCQRYYEVIGSSFGGNAYSTTYFMGASGFRVTKRATPTIALLTTSPQLYQAGVGNITATSASNGASNANVDGFYMSLNGFSGLTQYAGCGMITASVFSASSEL